MNGPDARTGTASLDGTGDIRPWSRRPEFYYALTLFACALALVGNGVIGQGGVLPGHSPAVAIFFVVFGLFTIIMGYLQPNAGYVSFDRVAQVASILVLGPVDAAWVNGLASLLFPWLRLREGKPLGSIVIAAFNNAGLMTVMILGAGSVYVALGGALPLRQLDATAGVALVGLVVTMQVLNDIGMRVLFRLEKGVWEPSINGFGLAVEVSGCIAAVVLAVVYNTLGMPVTGLLLLVMGLAMVALAQFARMRNRLQLLVDERTRSLREKTRQLERLATRDQLTGLANRRYADEFVDRHVEEHARYQRPFSIALADLDYFKRVNDHHSHEIGDRVLQRVAAILVDTCRSADVVARYGGEEFLLCFPETTADAAAAICEKLRRAVAGHDWGAIRPGIHVSMSLGVAELGPGVNRRQLLNAADQRLYLAKERGRDRVVA